MAAKRIRLVNYSLSSDDDEDNRIDAIIHLNHKKPAKSSPASTTFLSPESNEISDIEETL